MRFIARTTLALMLALWGAAVGPAGAQTSEGTPQRGGTLTYGIVAEPPTYDCHAGNTFAILHRVSPHYSTLLTYKTGAYPEIVGDAAESWTVSPDNLVYTFKLRPGIRFHDGTPFTSEDVKASYDRLRAPPPGIVSIRQPWFARIDTVETPDPLTVVFRLKEVDAAMLTVFASPWNCLFSAARLKADPNFPARNVMGTGPFKFVEHVSGSHWVGERFDGYFRQGHPYLDGFRAVTMTTSSVINALDGRQIQAEFRGFAPNERDRLLSGLGKDATVHEAGWNLHMLISFNTQKKPFDDVRVRRALSLALDRWGGAQSLGKISALGYVGGVVRPGSEWSASEAEMQGWAGFGRDMAANRAEARRLLKEAGAENLTFTLSNRNIVPYVAFGVFLIDQWRQIGVKVEHAPLELATWTSALAGGNFEAMVDTVTESSDDPGFMMLKYISYDRSPTATARATDRELDGLYDRQAREADKAVRMGLVRQFEQRVFDTAYQIPVLWWRRIVVTNARVHGWTMSPSHFIYQDLGDVWLSPEAR